MHRAHASIQEEEPVVRLVELARALREADLVVFVVLSDQILHDGTALEQPDRFAICESVRKGRNAAIRVDLEEPRFLLGVFRDINLLNFVRQPEGD